MTVSAKKSRHVLIVKFLGDGAHAANQASGVGSVQGAENRPRLLLGRYFSAGVRGLNFFDSIKAVT